MPLSRILGLLGATSGVSVGGRRGSLRVQRDLEAGGSYYGTCVGDPERAVAQINEAIRVDALGHYG